ncbi:AMP deaminase [Coemansia sp. RSA 1086]|nr:AMP deaminase [Coemansia sp. RSA 1086]
MNASINVTSADSSNSGSPVLHAALDPAHSGDQEDSPESHGADSQEHHPYLSRRAMSKTSFAAEQAFVNSMFDKQDEQEHDAQASRGKGVQTSEPTTPHSILMSQRLGQAHADAVLPQLSPRVAPHRVEQLKASSPRAPAHADHSKMPPLSLDGADKEGDEEDMQGRRLEHELRQMMMQAETDGTQELAGMVESTQELQRIGRAFRRCMRLRTKYMKTSLQRESDNPRNQRGWKIYPPAPQPAWRNYREPSSTAATPNFSMSECEIPGKDPMAFRMVDGVFAVFDREAQFSQAPSMKEFFSDLDYLLDTISDGPIKTWAFRRLRYLDARWQLYVLLNEREETMQSKMVPHRDLYNVRKVDVHVHLAAAMNQKHLLRFIKYKLKTEPDREVILRDGRVLTLREVFASLNLTAYDLSIDTLDMHAHKGAYHRFDKFNLKYNPVGESRLREIFMKTDNYIHGEYFAQLTKEVSADLEQSKYQMAEYRISIYGRAMDEWDKLAAWVVDNQVFSHNVRWLIQVPRLYNVYRASGAVGSFAEVLDNLFRPLYEVTQDPGSHPKLHVFLQRVIGFDSVDDESKPERRLHKKFPAPQEWTHAENPPYSYYCYFTMANLCALNQWRARRGFSTFVFRPHSGEAGDTEHLAAAFLSSQSISHGILLRKVPALQYLYYLLQIGLAMSPLSNNALFLVYERNPFNTYFQRGLNVALSTDDPLQFHFTKEPLMEEYSVAAQIWKYSSVDMCELAMNSVIQSGFEAEVKRHWIGRDYLETGQTEVHKTNVPLCRLKYRSKTLEQELSLIAKMVGGDCSSDEDEA